MRTMERGEEHDVGNGLYRGHVNVFVVGKMPAPKTIQ